MGTDITRAISSGFWLVKDPDGKMVTMYVDEDRTVHTIDPISDRTTDECLAVGFEFIRKAEAQDPYEQAQQLEKRMHVVGELTGVMYRIQKAIEELKGGGG